MGPSFSTLVTGGTGFLGRHLVERLLAAGRHVTILGRTPAPDLERRGVRFIRASLDDASAVAAACTGIDTIFHVAAKVGISGPYQEFFKTNVLGTRALLDGARTHGVRRFIHTSTPSVVYNGQALADADESLPLTTDCPSPYPLTKAIAEREVLAANSPNLRTVALRPHLIWGVGDPHLVPRVLARARAGRLRIVGDGKNKVDMVHVENATDAHLLAERALIAHPQDQFHPKGDSNSVAGRAYFITNGEPVLLWDWINALLKALGESPITRRLPLHTAATIGAVCETLWHTLPLRGEPPITRFIAAELAKDHWFNLGAARRDLGYVPRISMAAGTAALVASLRASRP
ncbi:MAG: 3-beta hydroxysteroid dehydrogenase [Opitutia bacterium]|nr:NAD-dependent epimerase/dehydratase family protein [Opitutaceae bacterium]PHX86477.1 MAG: 3-beta hydroxysteroid dehydrogenase [Opitutae bacterium]